MQRFTLMITFFSQKFIELRSRCDSLIKTHLDGRWSSTGSMFRYPKRQRDHFFTIEIPESMFTLGTSILIIRLILIDFISTIKHIIHEFRFYFFSLKII